MGGVSRTFAEGALPALAVARPLLPLRLRGKQVLLLGDQQAAAAAQNEQQLGVQRLHASVLHLSHIGGGKASRASGSEEPWPLFEEREKVRSPAKSPVAPIFPSYRVLCRVTELSNPSEPHLQQTSPPGSSFLILSRGQSWSSCLDR